MKRVFLRVFVLCAAFLMIGGAGPAMSAPDDAPPKPSPGKKSAYSAAELKRMSTFLSNFTERGLMDFDTKELAANNPPAELIEFGIWHNYINNYKSRIGRCKVKNCQWGELTIEGKHVAESVKKYFDVDLKLVSLTEDGDQYYYDGQLYHFPGADGEAVYYARVTEAHEEASGRIRMSGELYNAEDETDRPGKFEALAKPYQYGGKDTWAILSFKTESAEAAAGHPVFIARGLAGVFENGEWSEGYGEIYLNVDGKKLNWDDLIGAGDDFFEKAQKEGASLEIPRLPVGRKLEYFSPEAKVGEGLVTGADYFYEGEAAGYVVSILFDGYEPEEGKLIVGVAEGINAVPAPTVQSADAKGFAFSCNHQGLRYSVTLHEAGSDDLVAGKLTAGPRSWDFRLQYDENTRASWPLAEGAEGGFFDLDGDGSLEFVVNEPGPNGGVWLFRADAEKGPEGLAYIYTGEE